MSTSEQDRAQAGGDLGSVIKRLRASRGLTLEQVGKSTVGADPSDPGRQVLTKQTLGNIENRNHKTFMDPNTHRALAQALQVHHSVIYGANAVSCGLAPIPNAAAGLIPEAFGRLTPDDQMLIRNLILSLAAKAR